MNRKNRPILEERKTGNEPNWTKYLHALLIKVNLLSKTDEVFCKTTTEQVKNFQSSHSLTVDGIVGEETWNALEKAVKRLELFSLINDTLPQKQFHEIKPKYVDTSETLFSKLLVEIKCLQACEKISSDSRELIVRRIRRALIQTTYDTDALGIQSLIIEFYFTNEQKLETLYATDEIVIQSRKISLKTVELIPVFFKKIDVLMEEYKWLRIELLQRLKGLDDIINYSLVTFGITFTAVITSYNSARSKIEKLPPPNIFSNEQKSIMCCSQNLTFIILVVIIPIFALAFNRYWLTTNTHIGRIGYFISRMEIEIDKAFGRFYDCNSERGEPLPLFDKYELDMDYETSLRRIRRQYRISDISDVLNWEPITITVFYIIVGSISIYTGWNLGNVELPMKIDSNWIRWGMVVIFIWGVFSSIKKIFINAKWFVALKISEDEVLKLKPIQKKTQTRVKIFGEILGKSPFL